jgi:hypothetical protein
MPIQYSEGTILKRTAAGAEVLSNHVDTDAGETRLGAFLNLDGKGGSGQADGGFDGPTLVSLSKTTDVGYGDTVTVTCANLYPPLATNDRWYVRGVRPGGTYSIGATYVDEHTLTFAYANNNMSPRNYQGQTMSNLVVAYYTELTEETTVLNGTGASFTFRALPTASLTGHITSITGSGDNPDASALIDGDVTTRWTSVNNAPGSLQIELDGAYEITAFRVASDPAVPGYATAFEWGGSMDGMNFQNVGGIGLTVTDDQPVEAPSGSIGVYRYVTISNITADGGVDPSIGEFELIGRPDPTATG